MSDYAQPDSFGLGDAAIQAAVEAAVTAQIANIFPISIALPCFAVDEPAGWVFLKGQATPADAPELLAYYGATLPDLQGRTVVGQGTHAEVASVLENDGLAVATRTPRHDSSVNDPSHVHGMNTNAFIAGGDDVLDRRTDVRGGTILDTTAAFTGISVGPGGTRPTDEVPWIVGNWIAPYR